jgi:hypothetical protein
VAMSALKFRLSRGPHRELMVLSSSSSPNFQDFPATFRRPHRPPFRSWGPSDVQKFGAE